MNLDDIRRARDLLSKAIYAESGEATEADISQAMRMLVHASEDDLHSVVCGKNPHWSLAERLALRMFESTDTDNEHALLKYLCSKRYQSTVLVRYKEEPDDAKAERVRKRFRALARCVTRIADEMDAMEVASRD